MMASVSSDASRSLLGDLWLTSVYNNSLFKFLNVDVPTVINREYLKKENGARRLGCINESIWGGSPL